MLFAEHLQRQKSQSVLKFAAHRYKQWTMFQLFLFVQHSQDIGAGKELN
jgi:hypothetical protein